MKDMISIIVVERSGFQGMVEQLNPRFDLPHKDYFSRIAIPSLYEETRQHLQEKLTAQSQCNFCFSATADLCSSCSSEPYMVYTIHFVNGTWKLHSHCLKVLYIPDVHTAECLQNGFKSILED